MINLKKMVTEDRNNSTSKGCLMAMVSKENCESIHKFNSKIVSDDILYTVGDEFGREGECHATILYGFVPDLHELQLRKLLEGQKEFVIKLTGISQFKNENFDVVKFSVESKTLRTLHEKAKQFPHESSFPDYKPHMTIAYVKKGTFDLEKDGMNINIPIKTICYSPAQGGKTYFELEKNRMS